MPTVEENKGLWDTTYDWNQAGDEWSSSWGGADMQWYGSILPRIHAFLPATTILEIAPGFGRWTHFLKGYCDQLIAVDLSERCVQHCKGRFQSFTNITCHVNDGKSLDMVANDSVDFVFSFDSLVHAEDDVLRAYIHQLAKKLRRHGVGFIHHSNLGEYSAYFSAIRRLPYKVQRVLTRTRTIETDAWRAISMTAAKFAEYVREAGLILVGQELMSWGTKRLTDTVSVFTTRDSDWARAPRILRNSALVEERSRLLRLSKLYGGKSFGRRDSGLLQ